MKMLKIILILFFSQNIFSQNIQQKTWRINTIIGSDMLDIQEFILTKIDLPNDSATSHMPIYGNTIIFNADGTFNAKYSAPCGNDCFGSSTGTYKIINNKSISLYVKEFNQKGFCENKIKKLNAQLGVYEISQESQNTIKLIKIN